MQDDINKNLASLLAKAFISDILYNDKAVSRLNINIDG